MVDEEASGDDRSSTEGVDADGPCDDDGVPVCLHCTAPLTTLTRYCPECGSPVGTFATTDPIQLIHSQGRAYRNAVGGQSNALVFWGMWLAFGPATLMNLGACWEILRHGEDMVFATLAVLLVLALEAVYVALLYRVTRNYVRRRRYRLGRCGVCKYDLRLLSEPRCPECGSVFDPDWLPEGAKGGPANRDAT